MLSIGNKTFMNLQEAVGWLLENNALPFQSTANYAGGVEIAMSTLINPSPAKVRVGSIIFFADSKVSTVVGVTSNSFIVSDQYNDLVDDVVYVSNVAINASGHLIVTLSNGDTIDAGLIKQVTGFSIDASQHLIANYNDGTNTDLGAIFTGNLSIAGNIVATGTIEQQTANYSQDVVINPSFSDPDLALSQAYSAIKVIDGVCHIIVNFKIKNNSASAKTIFTIAGRTVFLPSNIASKLYDVEGHNASEALGTANLITLSPSVVCKNVTSPVAFTEVPCAIINGTSANSIAISTGISTGVSLDANTEYVFSSRVALSLL